MKKKRIGLLKPLSLLLFMLLFVNLSTTCKAYTIDDYQLNDEIMEAIVNEIGLGNYFSGDYIPTLTNNFNLMMRTVRARGDYHQVTLGDCIFFKKSNTQFAVTFDSYRDILGGYSQDASLETQSHYFNVGSVQESTNGNISVLGFVNWIYDSNNNITNALTEGIKYWYFNYNGYGYLTTTSNTINAYLYENDTYELTVGNYVILNNSTFDYIPMQVYRYSALTGYNRPFYENTIYLGDFNPIVTPTPIPTSGGGGGGSVIVDGGMTQAEFEQGQENFWGSSEDITGDSQIDFSSGEVFSLIDEFSGDITSLGFFGVISEFEQKFEDIFNNRDENNLDFIISWDNVDISLFGSDFRMIPSGDINFSKYCRDFPILGNVQTTIRVIFNFFFGFNLLQYLYNLVLSTLGIDNPYLYENPEYFEEHILYDVNTGYTDEISTTTYHSKPHHTISMRKRGRYYND